MQLARCLRDLPHQEAFAAYERLRRARAERIIAMGARTNTAKAAGPVARVLRDLLMPVAMSLFAKPEKLAWTEASWNGLVVRVLHGPMTKTLRKATESGLLLLKTEAERQAATTSAS